MADKKLKILTWHVHGNYLYYLTQVPHEFYLVYDTARSDHHSGRSGTLPWGDNVHEVHVDEVKNREFDVIMYQSRDAWDEERETILNAAQQRLPRVYIEHDPPQGTPTDTRHWVDDAGTLLVHVTPFNQLMWDSGSTPTIVVEHGIKPLGDERYTGELNSGIVVVNNLDLRGRRLGADVYLEAAKQVPLVLVGMGALRMGGHGEVENRKLPAFVAQYRFFFNPIRYTSLGLAILEAMMVGSPIVGLATTELVTVIRDGENGFIDTRLPVLVDRMKQLLADPGLARELGLKARATALERFGIERFVADWLQALKTITE